LPTEAPPPENQSLDETALIEDRRLKRQAIKARLKTQPGSSLNQELQLSSESGHSTPTADRSDPLAERSGKLRTNIYRTGLAEIQSYMLLPSSYDFYRPVKSYKSCDYWHERTPGLNLAPFRVTLSRRAKSKQFHRRFNHPKPPSASPFQALRWNSLSRMKTN